MEGNTYKGEGGGSNREYEQTTITIKNKRIMGTNENAKAKKTKKAAAVEADQNEEKPKLPTSWDEYCEQMKGKPSFTSYTGDVIIETVFGELIHTDEFDNKEMLVAFDAFARLLKLHKAWIGDWKPDWKTYKDEKYIIATKRGEIDFRSTWVNSSPMCFPTIGMRKLFHLYFRELLEKAKPLL